MISFNTQIIIRIIGIPILVCFFVTSIISPSYSYEKNSTALMPPIITNKAITVALKERKLDQPKQASKRASFLQNTLLGIVALLSLYLYTGDVGIGYDDSRSPKSKTLIAKELSGTLRTEWDYEWIRISPMSDREKEGKLRKFVQEKANELIKIAADPSTDLIIRLFIIDDFKKFGLELPLKQIELLLEQPGIISSQI